MSRTASWGHYLLALYLVVRGILFIRDEALVAIRNSPGGPESASFAGIGWDFLIIALWLAFIWGVMTWAKWAHAILVGWSALVSIVSAYALQASSLRDFGILGVLSLMMTCAIFVWLMLPSVRAVYWRRKEPAT